MEIKEWNIPYDNSIDYHNDIITCHINNLYSYLKEKSDPEQLNKSACYLVLSTSSTLVVTIYCFMLPK